MKILHHREDLRSVGFIVTLLGLMALQWAGVFRHPAMYVVTLVLAFLACIVNHNHQHCLTFVPAWLNRIFGMLISCCMGQPATAIVPMHNRNHHVHNNSPEDFVRSSLVSFRWNLLNLIAFPVVALLRYSRAKSGEIRKWKKREPRLHRQVVWERWVFYPLALTLLFLRPVETLVFIVLPWLSGQWGILAINLVQHDGCDFRSRYNHSRNFTGRWLNWWFLNNGFHTAHHLRPGLHWTRLRQYHGTFREAIHPRLERRSLFLALASFYLWPAHRPVLEELQR